MVNCSGMPLLPLPDQPATPGCACTHNAVLPRLSTPMPSCFGCSNVPAYPLCGLHNILHRREALPFVAEGRTWIPGMRAVTRTVFGSPTITAVNLDSSRSDAQNPEPCYPDICFAVDNFDNTFEDMVRLRTDWARL